jgi:hypothetical protein
MVREDPRVGLSIDSSSASCASDLSDSQSSWEDYPPLRQGPLSFPDGSSWNSEEIRIVRDLPRTPSFRSRLPQRDRRLTAGSWDDDVRIAQHPRAPSLRLCLTLGTLTLVMLSLMNTNSSHPVSIDLDIQQEQQQQQQVVLPLFSDADKFHVRREPQVRGHKASPDAGHGAAALSSGGSEPKPLASAAARPRANLAMARSGPSRPVFGAHTPQVERFLHQGAGPGEHSFQTERTVASSSKWHSWLAAVALVAMLLETGYKEYRRCRITEEVQRRL